MDVDEVIEHHLPRLVRFFQNKFPADYEDLVQQTIVFGLEGHQRRARSIPFEHYLFGVARNVLFDTYRKRRKRNERGIDVNLESVADLAEGPSTVARERCETSRLLVALRQLSLEDQCVIELYFWERMKAREIAASLEMAEGTVRTRIRRAKARILELLEATRSPGIRKASDCDVERWAEQVRREWDVHARA